MTRPGDTAVPIASHSTHTCAQRMLNLDYINSMPTLQKDFKNEPNNRRTISSVIPCFQVGLSRHIGGWFPNPTKFRRFWGKKKKEKKRKRKRNGMREL